MAIIAHLIVVNQFKVFQHFVFPLASAAVNELMYFPDFNDAIKNIVLKCAEIVYFVAFIYILKFNIQPKKKIN